MSFRHNLALAAMALACLCAPLASLAQDKSKLGVEQFFAYPKFFGVVLSPDGEHLAATAPVQGRMNLVTLNLKDRKPVVVTAFKDFDVVNFSWVNNERLVYTLGNINEPSESLARTGGGLFAVDLDGSDTRTLALTVRQARDRGDRIYRSMSFVGRTPELSDEVIVAANERSDRQRDLYRVDTRTGRKALLSFDNPGDVESWILDRTGAARAAISSDDENKVTTWYRKAADAKWEKQGEYALFEPSVLPLAFGYDGTMYVISNIGRDKYAIYTYDPEGKAVKDLVYEHPEVDVGVTDFGVGIDPGKLVFDPKARKLVGVRHQGLKPGTHWIDAEWGARQASLDAALPGMVNTFALPRYSDRFVVTSGSDRSPTTFYLFDRATRKLEFLVSTYPDLKAEQLVEMKPVTYKARDGMEIPAYLFVPKGSEGKKLPLVVNIHGGPQVRADTWGLRLGGPMESQFLAHNGYAVLLPQFRMTPGFGRKLYTGGVRQFGKAMSDDIEDGVDWLVKQGIVDEKRVCLYGASYGGYATLWGLARAPDKFKCGVAALVVANLHLQLTSVLTDFVASKPAVHFWAKMVGDPARERDVLDSLSPVYQADKIKAPLLIISGQDDRRTPIEQAEGMRAALQKAGKEPEWWVAAEEGHGFAKAENRYEMYTRMLKFLDKHIGPGK